MLVQLAAMPESAARLEMEVLLQQVQQALRVAELSQLPSVALHMQEDL